MAIIPQYMFKAIEKLNKTNSRHNNTKNSEIQQITGVILEEVTVPCVMSGLNDNLFYILELMFTIGHLVPIKQTSTQQILAMKSQCK